MTLAGRIAATGILLAIAIALLDRFLHWMNLPSDVKLYSGGFGVMCLVVAVPAGLKAIWRSGA
jgi:hypothetical protein